MSVVCVGVKVTGLWLREGREVKRRVEEKCANPGSRVSAAKHNLSQDASEKAD